MNIAGDQARYVVVLNAYSNNLNNWHINTFLKTLRKLHGQYKVQIWNLLKLYVILMPLPTYVVFLDASFGVSFFLILQLYHQNGDFWLYMNGRVVRKRNLS